MGREIRRVPADWQHPKDGKGNFIPMQEHFSYNAEEIAEGLADGWLTDTPPNYGCDIMPQWPEAERTHLMMYEDCSEGTPISPAFATPEELAHWLADNGASAFGERMATYEQWLQTCKSGWSVGAIFTPETGLISGVEGEFLLDQRKEG